MTEHSLSLGQTNDNQKSEIARLQEQVRQLQLDLEAKDARMEDSLRLKKKAQKKVKALEESVQNAELAAQVCDMDMPSSVICTAYIALLQAPAMHIPPKSLLPSLHISSTQSF